MALTLSISLGRSTPMCPRFSLNWARLIFRPPCCVIIMTLDPLYIHGFTHVRTCLLYFAWTHQSDHLFCTPPTVWNIILKRPFCIYMYMYYCMYVMVGIVIYISFHLFIIVLYVRCLGFSFHLLIIIFLHLFILHTAIGIVYAMYVG